VTTFAGVLALLIGLSYAALGLLACYELGRHASSRGFSHIGGAVALMAAATCGPHYLVHAEHLLLRGGSVSGAVVAALAIGVVPGTLFVLLRTEALLGGNGDRFISGTPLLLAVLPWAYAVAAGAIVWSAIGTPDGSSAAVALNVVLFAAYLLIGVLVVRTQVARRPMLGGWSLSGLALGSVFVTCAVTHLTSSLAMVADAHSLVVDAVSVPVALYFLWVVRSLHRNGLRDWNRRPLVGRSERRRRPSPWAA